MHKLKLGNLLKSKKILLIQRYSIFVYFLIIGYTGHIPRIFPTELGLGARYNQTTAKGLAEFKNNYLRQTTNFDMNRERS